MDRAATLPLLGWSDPDAVLAWYQGRAVTVREFLAQAVKLAETLPAGRFCINLCENPYLFLLGFAAALLARRTNLLPPNRLPHTLRALGAHYAADLVLCDSAAATPVSESLRAVEVTPPRVDGGQAAFRAPNIGAAHIAAVLFTSGSTGQSQAFPKTWRTLVLGARANARASLPNGLHPTMVGTVPAQHSYGLETLVLLPLQGYGSLCGERPFFPQDVAHALRAAPSPRVLVTTPVHLRALCEAQLQLPPVASIWSATAPLPQTLAAACEHRFDAPVHEIYGCTEVGTCATRRTTREELWRLMDEFTLTLRGEKSGGGAWISAPHLSSGALLQDEFEQPDPRHFHLLGRGADLINIAGKRASLADLNHKLLGIPGVVDGAIFLPDAVAHQADAVQRTAALVVAPTLTGAQVLEALREIVDPAFVPRPLFLVDSLPRNEATKLPRTALQKLFEDLKSHD